MPLRTGVTRARSRPRLDGRVINEESGAHETVVEAQRIQPPLVQQMVHGRPVVGIRTTRQDRAGRGRRVGKRSHSLEVAIQESGRESDLGGLRLDTERSRQHFPGPGGVHHEPRITFDRVALVPPAQPQVVTSLLDGHHFELVAVVDAGRAGLRHQVRVHIGPQPVTISNAGVRTGRYQHPRLVRLAVAIRAVGMMAVKREAALQTAAETRQRSAPPAVGGQAMQVRLLIPGRKALERQRRQRCR